LTRKRRRLVAILNHSSWLLLILSRSGGLRLSGRSNLSVWLLWSRSRHVDRWISHDRRVLVKVQLVLDLFLSRILRLNRHAIAWSLWLLRGSIRRLSPRLDWLSNCSLTWISSLAKWHAPT